jgi:hypothetical protein
MTGPTIRYQVRFRSAEESRLVAALAARTADAGKEASEAPTAPRPTSGAPGAAVPATARVLALAYAIERQVRAGALANYRDAARRLGISHARISQVMALLLLSPRMQAEVLSGTTPWSEVRLRALTRAAGWDQQRGALPPRGTGA